MAKIPFTKLGLVKNTEVENIYWNGQTIEVKQYLPIQEKLELIADAINNCQDDNNFINEAKLYLFVHLEIVFKYTNVNFTDKQKEDSFKLYDLLTGTNFLKEVLKKIPEDEYHQVISWTKKIANNIYDYRNSVYAILDALKTDYDDLNFDAEAIKENLKDAENLSLLKNVLTKLG